MSFYRAKRPCSAVTRAVVNGVKEEGEKEEEEKEKEKEDEKEKEKKAKRREEGKLVST